MERLAEVSETEVRIDFSLNSKCRTTVRLTSLCPSSPLAFKVQTSSPHKFLVNPPAGLIPPSSFSTFQIVLRPQTHPPPTFPRSPSDRFLVKVATFTPNNSPDSCASLAAWFSSLPHGSTQDFKLKVAFVGPFLLHHAVSRGDIDTVRNIIKRQKSILSELPLREAESLLRVAAGLANSSEGMVNVLLEAGLKVEFLVKLESCGLYQLDPKWESKGWSELHLAAAFGQTEEGVIDLARGFGSVDLRDKEGRTPFHLAVSGGNIRVAKVLVKLGADKDAKAKDGRTGLHRAAANGDTRMAEMLVELGADPAIEDDHGRSPLDVALHMGHQEVVEILERGELVLKAARRGELERLESLLQRGANMNYCDQYGLTALHAAAINGHKQIVSMLVEYGFDLECQDHDGHTPLHMAVQGGSAETVEVLLNNGANVNAKSKPGATPLHMAKAIGYDDISQFLVNKGAASSPPSSLSIVPLFSLLHPTIKEIL